MSVKGYQSSGLQDKNPLLLSQARQNIFASGLMSWPKFIPLGVLGALGLISPTYLMTATILARRGIYTISDPLFWRLLKVGLAIVINTLVTIIILVFLLDKPVQLQFILSFHRIWMQLFLLACVLTGLGSCFKCLRILWRKRL